MPPTPKYKKNNKSKMSKWKSSKTLHFWRFQAKWTSPLNSAFFSYFFQLRFWWLFFAVLSFFDSFWGSQGWQFWSHFVKKRGFWWKRGPLFLHTLTVFWLGFEGLGLPGGRKKREKTPSKKTLFFWSEKKAAQTVFCDFRLLFGIILGGLSDDLRVCFGVFF